MTISAAEGRAGPGMNDQLGAIRRRVDARLAEIVPDESVPPAQLHRAMRYSLFGSAKRIRPLMTVLITEHLGGDAELAIDPACAIEMVHTASLILDDLPMMDNATLRRGRPANHVVFGEDTALLAGLALLNRAFGVVSETAALPARVRVELVRLMSDAIGCNGVIGGQERELHVDERHHDRREVEEIHTQKTAALFVAAAEMGARLADIDEAHVQRVRRFALNLGLAFQTVDDLIDLQSSESAAGKNVRQDDGKATLVACMGPEQARVMAERFVGTAVAALRPLGAAGEPLAEFARSLALAGQGSESVGGCESGPSLGRA